VNDPRADEDLLLALRGGDKAALGPLVRRYERELFHYLARYLRDETLAADVFQLTFLAVFRKIQQYEPGRPARPWLYTVATNQAIDASRRKARRPDQTAPEGFDDPAGAFAGLPATTPDPADETEAAETRARVRAAVDELPEALRQTVILAYFQGLKYSDVAEALGVPVGTVKSRLHAAVAKLAAAWTRVEDETADHE
jgi:RNA polymerase sigma-70 factor, ECF subfamily